VMWQVIFWKLCTSRQKKRIPHFRLITAKTGRICKLSERKKSIRFFRNRLRTMPVGKSDISSSFGMDSALNYLSYCTARKNRYAFFKKEKYT
jgi:hypothetical protein